MEGGEPVAPALARVERLAEHALAESPQVVEHELGGVGVAVGRRQHQRRAPLPHPGAAHPVRGVLLGPRGGEGAAADGAGAADAVAIFALHLEHRPQHAVGAAVDRPARDARQVGAEAGEGEDAADEVVRRRVVHRAHPQLGVVGRVDVRQPAEHLEARAPLLRVARHVVLGARRPVERRVALRVDEGGRGAHLEQLQHRARVAGVGGVAQHRVALLLAELRAAFAQRRVERREDAVARPPLHAHVLRLHARLRRAVVVRDRVRDLVLTWLLHHVRDDALVPALVVGEVDVDAVAADEGRWRHRVSHARGGAARHYRGTGRGRAPASGRGGSCTPS